MKTDSLARRYWLSLIGAPRGSSQARIYTRGAGSNLRNRYLASLLGMRPGPSSQRMIPPSSELDFPDSKSFQSLDRETGSEITTAGQQADSGAHPNLAKAIADVAKSLQKVVDELYSMEDRERIRLRAAAYYARPAETTLDELRSIDENLRTLGRLSSAKNLPSASAYAAHLDSSYSPELAENFSAVMYISKMLGRPRNFGHTHEVAEQARDLQIKLRDQLNGPRADYLTRRYTYHLAEGLSNSLSHRGEKATGEIALSLLRALAADVTRARTIDAKVTFFALSAALAGHGQLSAHFRDVSNAADDLAEALTEVRDLDGGVRIPTLSKYGVVASYRMAYTDYRGADLGDVDLHGVRLSGVRWDQTTRWPQRWVREIRARSAETSPGSHIYVIDAPRHPSGDDIRRAG